MKNNDNYNTANVNKIKEVKLINPEPRVRIIPLGGLEEVGRNCTIIEYYEPETKKRDIIIIDLGLQFPEEAMMGIDFVIPNTYYLQNKIKDIKGIIITHGHYDHIGAIPYLMDKLGNPPIFAGALARSIILKRQDDFPNAQKPKIKIMNSGEKIDLGVFNIEFVHVNHNIPDSFSLYIKTPTGTIYHSGDFKFDRNPAMEAPADIGRIANIGKEGVDVLMSDSTSVNEKGQAIPEESVKQELEKIFDQYRDYRIIIGTISSNIGRIAQILEISEKMGRFVAVEGYSMKSNVLITKELGYLKLDAKTLISSKKATTLSPSKVTIMCTGAQGEDRAALMRIAQKEHKFLELTNKDVVLFSSSVIPGNERTVQTVHDLLARQAGKVINYRMMGIHSGGHARAEDAKMLISLIKPKYLIPIHGNYFMLKAHTEIGQELGMKPERTFALDNGNIFNLSKKDIWISKKKVPTNYIMVDGLGVGDVGEIVLRDRQKMAEEGMFTIIILIDSQTGKVKEPIDIISRGFIYMNDRRDLVNEARNKIKEIVMHTASQEPFNASYVRDELREELGEFLYKKTHRRPLILPVVMKI